MVGCVGAVEDGGCTMVHSYINTLLFSILRRRWERVGKWLLRGVWEDWEFWEGWEGWDISDGSDISDDSVGWGGMANYSFFCRLA